MVVFVYGTSVLFALEDTGLTEGDVLVTVVIVVVVNMVLLFIFVGVFCEVVPVVDEDPGFANIVSLSLTAFFY